MTIKPLSRIWLAAIVAAAFTSAACFSSSSSATMPSSTSMQALGGTWASSQSLPGISGSLQDACTNFQWAVTEFSGMSGSGTFSATCQGNVQIAGTARGTMMSASSVTWSATATATVPGQSACAINLSGTATIETNQIRIPYSGSTCLGPVSGTEIIKRK